MQDLPSARLKFDFMSNMFKSFLGEIGGGLFSSIGSHLGNVIFGETLADRQRYALEQMAKQQEYNVANYEKQLQDQLRYSDPSFIRSRLELAGLSPALAFQNGNLQSPISARIGDSNTAGGLGSSSLIRGSSLALTASQLSLNKSQENVNNANADVQKALAAKYRSETPTDGNLGDAEIEVKNSIKLLNSQLASGALSEKEYKDALAVGQTIENTFNSWNMDNRKELSEVQVDQSRMNLIETIQRYDFNESNNEILLQLNEQALKQACLDYFVTELRAEALKSEIKLTDAQVLNAIAENNVLKQQAQKIYQETKTERQLRGYKKAESVMRSVNGFIISLGSLAGGIGRILKPSIGEKTIITDPSKGIDYPKVPTDPLGRIYGTY